MIMSILFIIMKNWKDPKYLQNRDNFSNFDTSINFNIRKFSVQDTLVIIHTV